MVVNHEWREGLASSIRAGVARLPATCNGVLLLLADQAAVTADDLKRLAGTWRQQPHCIAAALYAGDLRGAGHLSAHQLPRARGAARR